MPSPERQTLIDAVNDRDEEIGTVLRGDVLKTGRNFRTAHVFVVNRKRELLLQRLASGRNRHPGRWGSSVAAYLFAGESYRHAAERRMQEELDLTVGLEDMGKLEIRDVRSLKFVSLFLAHSDTARIGDRDHISELRYWDLPQLEDAVAVSPSRFTPTFVALFEHFAQRLH